MSDALSQVVDSKLLFGLPSEHVFNDLEWGRLAELVEERTNSITAMFEAFHRGRPQMRIANHPAVDAAAHRLGGVIWTHNNTIAKE